MGKPDKAIVQFKTYLKFNPYDAQRLYELALIYGELKRYKMAVKYLEKALSYDSHNPRFMLNLAKLYEIQSELDMAEDLFIRMIDENRAEKSYYTEFINFYRRSNQPSKAQTLTYEMYKRFSITK